MDASDRGIVFPGRLPTFHRIRPPDSVADLVVWFWIPEWDLPPGEIARQQVISFPASNLVVEADVVGLAGPTTTSSFRNLSGRGWAVGALLRPAAVPAFTEDPARLRDDYLRMDLPALHEVVATEMNSGAVPELRRAEAVARFAEWVSEHVPAAEGEGLLANAAVELLTSDSSVCTLGDAAAALHVAPRTLQRLATRYVGLSPTAMIRRRRLQEAAERLRDEPELSLAEVAVELGYSDHAHLTRDFRAVLGLSPSEYRRQH
ncbi:AraC family transcriptional regulator [Nocardioides limicola]|uniref:AraC family transcriptional regulator n=1 Tax=Nocardioides limicola TaxID=2803368 RepID=UPI00193B4559|nr:helix-turn-helix domain-containing protein [Nocardioides sp. DJM-14]